MSDLIKLLRMNKWHLNGRYDSEAADEIERLTAINSSLCDKSNSYIIENARLTEERDALRADAERYRWLRTETENPPNGYPLAHVVWKLGGDRRGSEWVNTATLDAAIDAARKDAQPSDQPTRGQP